MSFYKFERQDIFHNRMKLHPDVHFYIKGEDVFYNKENNKIRSGNETIKQVPHGHLNLYELNINRDDGVGDSNLIYPYITKSGTLNSFGTVSTSEFQGFSYGDEMSGSYPLSSTIAVDLYLSGNTYRRRIKSLRNTFNHYAQNSYHYMYKTPDWDKDTQDIKLVSIPSIFYGSSIKKGTVKLNFFVSGSVVGTLEDVRQNGELVQTFPEDANNQRVAGVVLYNEGFVSLTGSWAISDDVAHKDIFLLPSTPDFPRWIYWGQRMSNPYTAESETPVKKQVYEPPPSTGGGQIIGPSTPPSGNSSWDITFKGTSYVSTMTMMAHAKAGDLNYSSNPTFIDFEDREVELTKESDSENKYSERKDRNIANVVKSFYPNTSGSFEKTTYISKVGIYDKNKNLIAIAKLATPVKKTESRSYTFKMKVDI